jgi:hypothetical protein
VTTTGQSWPSIELGMHALHTFAICCGIGNEIMKDDVQFSPHWSGNRPGPAERVGCLTDFQRNSAVSICGQAELNWNKIVKLIHYQTNTYVQVLSWLEFQLEVERWLFLELRKSWCAWADNWHTYYNRYVKIIVAVTQPRVRLLTPNLKINHEPLLLDSPVQIKLWKSSKLIFFWKLF